MRLPKECPNCGTPVGSLAGPFYYGPEPVTPIAEIFVCSRCGYKATQKELKPETKYYYKEVKREGRRENYTELVPKENDMINQEMSFVNHDDADGNPAGGWVSAVGLSIQWQDGPLGAPDDPERQEPNGAFVETVIRAAMQRIAYYQDTKFHCLENAIALGHLSGALTALEERTKARTDRNVEGTHNE